MEFYVFVMAIALPFGFFTLMECRIVRKKYPESYQARLDALLNIAIPFLVLLLIIFAIAYYESGAAVYSK